MGDTNDYSRQRLADFLAARLERAEPKRTTLSR